MLLLQWGKGRVTPTYSDVAEYVDEEGVEPDYHEGEEEDVEGGRAAHLPPQAQLSSHILSAIERLVS